MVTNHSVDLTDKDQIDASHLIKWQHTLVKTSMKALKV